MKVKGDIGALIAEDLETEKKLTETAWYKEINTSKIPYAKRPKGGCRYDFKGYSNLQDMALEIKEAAPYNFVHTGDVHRNAHYIGMYILREMHVYNQTNREVDEMIAATAPIVKRARKLALFRDQFMKIYDLYVERMLSEDQLDAAIKEMLDKLNGDQESKEWLLNDIEKTLSDASVYSRTKSKLYMRKYRAKESGLRVIGRESD